jgi:hypothetical protein
MFGRGITAAKIGFTVAFNALGLAALLAAAWLMPYVLEPYVLELTVRVTGVS